MKTSLAHKPLTWQPGPKGATGEKGSQGPRGYPGAGAQGPPGPPVAAPEPVSVSLTRDSARNVESVTPEGQSTWEISRTVDGSIAELSDSSKIVTVNRDADGRVTGVSVSEA